MSKSEIKIISTLDGIKSYLLDGQSPRDIGGRDALANRRLPGGNYLPAFLREVHTKAEGLAHAIVEGTQDQFGDIAGALRNNPFAVDNAMQQARAEPASVAAAINERIEHQTAEFLEQRQEADNAGIVYRRDLQAAGASHPRGGWKDSAAFWPIVSGVVMIETGIGAVVLWHALGPTRAILTAAALSLVSLGGGVLSALALLRPTKKELVTALGRAGQWALATVAGMTTAVLSYVGACYRSAWIDGLDGKPADMIEKFLSPASVLIDFDVLTLAALGLVGFCIGAREFFKFYHGHRSLLRESGMAKSRADNCLRAKADELKAFAKRVGDDGIGRLGDIDHRNSEWVRASADHLDHATATKLEANRRLDLTRRAFEGIVAEYIDGYLEVKPTAAAPEIFYAPIGTEVDVPQALLNARGAVIEAAARVSDCVRAASLEISAMIISAVARIDDLAGFRLRVPDVGLLQSGRPS